MRPQPSAELFGQLIQRDRGIEACNAAPPRASALMTNANYIASAKRRRIMTHSTPAATTIIDPVRDDY